MHAGYCPSVPVVSTRKIFLSFQFGRHCGQWYTKMQTPIGIRNKFFIVPMLATADMYASYNITRYKQASSLFVEIFLIKESVIRYYGQSWLHAPLYIRHATDGPSLDESGLSTVRYNTSEINRASHSS